jgi:hypothetical protein
VKIFLCEGTFDIELFSHVFQLTGYELFKNPQGYIDEKLGLINLKIYKVIQKNSDEIFIFFPKSGGGKTQIIQTVTNIAQQIAWKQKGVNQLILALDIDDDKNLIDTVFRVLKTVYTVTKKDKFSFSCKDEISKMEFLFTIVPVGDPRLSTKIDVNQSKLRIEDIILSLALRNEKYKGYIENTIKFYVEQKGKKPDTKALIRIIEGLCDDPEKGVYQILSQLKNELVEVLPEDIVNSLKEIN